MADPVDRELRVAEGRGGRSRFGHSGLHCRFDTRTIWSAAHTEGSTSAATLFRSPTGVHPASVDQ